METTTLSKEYITASCVISGQVVYSNERAVFENKAADLPSFLLSIYDHFDLQYAKFYKMDLLSKLGWLTAELLLKEGFNATDYRPEDTGIVLSNSNASLDTDHKYYATIKSIPSPSVFVYTLPNIMIGEICIRNKFKGENAFFIFEFFDPVFVEQYVTSLLKTGLARTCICGWVDLMEDEYKACLFLVESETIAAAKGVAAEVSIFTAKNMDRIFQMPNT
jgi:hypothetical protein